MARKGKKTKRKAEAPLGPDVAPESGSSVGNDILTVDQAATYLRVARSTLYKLVRRGAVPCMKVGGAVRFSRRTLLGWVESESMRTLAEETPDAVLNKPKEGSPDAEREYIAARLGRTKSSLDDFVSKWRGRFGKDLPWVIRKPGLPWIPDLDAFEEWRKTTEGEKAVVKRTRGRPPRS